jgi:hypothetical protein
MVDNSMEYRLVQHTPTLEFGAVLYVEVLTPFALASFLVSTARNAMHSCCGKGTENTAIILKVRVRVGDDGEESRYVPWFQGCTDDTYIVNDKR